MRQPCFSSMHAMHCQSRPISENLVVCVPGGGVTQIVMPYLAQGIEHHTYSFRAWRWAFFFPGCLQIIWGLMILWFAQVNQRNFCNLSSVMLQHGLCIAPALHSLCVQSCLRAAPGKVVCVVRVAILCMTMTCQKSYARLSDMYYISSSVCSRLSCCV